MKVRSENKGKKNSLFARVKNKIFYWLRLNNHSVIRVYHGYGNDDEIVVLGHVLKLSPFPRQTYRSNWVVNFFSALRLFMVVPYSRARVSVEWQGEIHYTRSAQDGFFRFEFAPQTVPEKGWQKVLVRLEEGGDPLRVVRCEGEIYIPFASQHGFVSDIDDTFLVSHSTRLRKKLYVLLTKNAHSRKPFEGVVHHYDLLARHNQVHGNCNPFFYVSGSEWNLYNLINEFLKINRLPKGICLLSTMKGVLQLWKSGGGQLMTKFTRIIRVIESFPHLQFVLLGDDSQMDAHIYLSVIKHFPGKVFAVYIRQVSDEKNDDCQRLIRQMEEGAVHCCYFRHSMEAIVHSEKIGLVDPEQVVE